MNRKDRQEAKIYSEIIINTNNLFGLGAPHDLKLNLGFLKNNSRKCFFVILALVSPLAGKEKQTLLSW